MPCLGNLAGKGGLMAALAVVPTLLFLFPSVSPAGGTATVSVSATVASRSVCRFQSRTMTLNFGNIDPGSPADVTATGTTVFRCGGSAINATFLITDDSGLHELPSGSPRMRSTTNPSEYLPYTLALNPRSGTVPRNTNRTLAATGTIRSVDFQDASPGIYTDTVVLTILP